MELRLENSQTSTRKNYENNDPIIIAADSAYSNTASAHVQDLDYFYINFVDHGTLAYTNALQHNLTIESTVLSFQSWRCLFRINFIKNMNKFYLIHCETNLYVVADVSKNEQASPIFSIGLTQKPNKQCQFQFQSTLEAKNKQQPLGPVYENSIKIINSQTEKYLQVTKQNRFPHLSTTHQTEIYFKLYRKGKICIEDLWITNEPSNFLQNGDLVLIQNTEKTSCLTLQLKSQLFYKNAELKPMVNKKLLQAENYVLTQKPIAQVKNSNIIFSLWRVYQVSSFSQCHNSVIYNRDTIVFRHCFTNICLLKSWSSQANFSSNIFELGKDGQQSSNMQNCGFHIRNKTTYCFSSKKPNQNAIVHQPLYLHDAIQLDHRYICLLQKVDYESIRYLRLFNQNIITFSEVLLDFITNQQTSQEDKLPETNDQKHTNISLSRKLNQNISIKNPRQLQPIDWQEILTVDYDKFKQMIRVYHRIFRILVRNKSTQSIYSNSYIMKISLLVLETIGNALKTMSDIKRRKQPILKPLILAIYEYFINVVNPKYCHFSVSIFYCLKKMLKIDQESTILVLYYLSRVWSYSNSIDLFIELLPQVEPEHEELVLMFIFDIIQHCSQWKDQEPKKIQEMFSSLGISINFSTEQGVTITSQELGTYSVLDFYQSDKKALLYLKIAVFSQAFANTNESIQSNEERLSALILQFENDKWNANESILNGKIGQTQGKIKSQLRLRQQERKPIYKSALLQFINFYLLSVCECAISTLKSRKFVLLNSEIQEYHRNESSSQSDQEIIISIQSQSNQKKDQSSAIMLNLLNRTGIELISQNQRKNKEAILMKGKIKPTTNIYSLVNYQEPSLSIIQLSDNFDKLIQCLQSWDSLKMRKQDVARHKIITIAPRQKKEEVVKEDDEKQVKIGSKEIFNPLDDNFKQISNLQKNGLQRQDREHLCFMLEGFNAVVSIMDIILSTGFTSIKMLCYIEQFALEIVSFMSKLSNKENNATLSNFEFAIKYEKTASELIKYYREIEQNEGLIIYSILIKQKIEELQLSLNELFNIIYMLKKRLIAHPAIQVIDRHKLFNFDACLTQYLSIYSTLYKPNKNQTKSIYIFSANLIQDQKQKSTFHNINLDLIRKMLNFYSGNYYDEGQQIVLLNLPNSNFKILNSKKNILKKEKKCESGESQISDSHSSNDKMDEDFTAKIPETNSNKQFINRYTASFKNCEEIVQKLQMLSMLRQSIDKGQLQRTSEISRMTGQIKKLLDLINEKLRQLTKRTSQVDIYIIRAYQVSEKLIESIFCTQNFEQDFIMDIVIFLCQNPPYFSNFAKLNQKLIFSLPLMKIFIKSLQLHLSTIIKEATIEYQVTQELKEAVSSVIRVIQNCKKELKPRQFILVMGVICQIFPNRAVSEKIYHILLEMHCEQRNNLNLGYTKKVNFKKLIFNNGFKEQTTIGKSNLEKLSILNEEGLKKLCPCRIVDGFKTLETFKDLVNEAQQEEDKCNEMEQNGNFIQLISSINTHISLIFRVCENSDQVNRHFTQNIIKYDSLLLIAFDPEIPIKYKIPMAIYFRNDDRIYDDQVAISDYLSWISVILRDYQQYFPQLKEYIYQNNFQYQQFHFHVATKSIRQKHYPRISLMIESYQKEQGGMASSIFSSFNTKISSRQYYYWQLLFSRPFMHCEEGVLILLEEIITNMKELPIKSQGSLKQNISRSVVEIYESLSGLYKRLTQKKLELKQKDMKNCDNDENSILDNLIRKIKKNLKLILEKYPSLREVTSKEIFSSQTIAFNIVNMLIKNNLLKKFIKVFYYNEYKNINLPIICDKKGQQCESQASDNSRLSFKHSRSSKMSHNSQKENCRVTEMAILKMSRKEVSIKQFENLEQDGCKSNQALLLNGDRFLKRRSTNSPNTIRLNLNKTHYFEERAYMFYEVSKLLARVCELVQDPQLKSKLQEQFILFFQFRGTSKILKEEMIGVLRYLRLNYIKQQKQKVGFQHSGFIRTIKSVSSNFSKTLMSTKQWNYLSLIVIVKDLILKDELKIVGQLLKCVENQKKSKNPNNTRKLSQMTESFSITPSNSVEILTELCCILKTITNKSCVGFNFYCNYLPILKHLLIVFLPQQKTNDNEIRLLERKISNLLAEYLNKILLNVGKYYEFRTTKKSEVKYERELRGKKQTIISQVNRMRESCDFTHFKLPQKVIEPLKRANTYDMKQKSQYLPQMQIECYRMIQLYAIAEAHMSQLQKELYELISKKLLKMVYGMTLGASLKLILKSLLQKCQFSSTILMPNIININQKLQYFIETKIKEMSDIKNLVSSNMNISEDLSFISIYYEYLYSLYWDYFLVLSSHSKETQLNKSKLENYEGVKISNDLWEAIVNLEQNIFLLLLGEKKAEGNGKKLIQLGLIKSEELNKNLEDFQRFRLLHKLLTQSINLFNIKAVTEILNQHSIRRRRAEGQFECKKEDFFVWTLNKFIESRTSISQPKPSDFAINESRIQLYTELFSYLSHLILPIEQAKSELVYSFLTQNLCCRAIFKTEDQQPKFAKQVYFYKNYQSDWNDALVSIINSKQKCQPKSISGISQKDAIKPNKNCKENKISYICDYLILEAQNMSTKCIIQYNNDFISGILTALSFFLVILSLILEYYSLGLIRTQQEEQVMQEIQNGVLQANFLCFVALFFNKFSMYWKISKLKAYVDLKMQETSEKELSVSNLQILQNLIRNYASVLMLIVLLLAFHVITILEHHFLPLLLFQVFLYYERLPSVFLGFIYKFLQAGWLPATLIYITILVFNNENALAIWAKDSTGQVGQAPSDTKITEFLNYFFVKDPDQRVNMLAIVFQNIVIEGYFFILVAAILGHLRWGLQNRQLYSSQKQQKSCILCDSKDSKHIKYKHNVVKWIDFEINLKSRCETSLSEFEKCIKNKIQKRELTLFYNAKKLVE